MFWMTEKSNPYEREASVGRVGLLHVFYKSNGSPMAS